MFGHSSRHPTSSAGLGLASRGPRFILFEFYEKALIVVSERSDALTRLAAAPAAAPLAADSSTLVRRPPGNPERRIASEFLARVIEERRRRLLVYAAHVRGEPVAHRNLHLRPDFVERHASATSDYGVPRALARLNEPGVRLLIRSNRVSSDRVWPSIVPENSECHGSSCSAALRTGPRAPERTDDAVCITSGRTTRRQRLSRYPSHRSRE